MRPCIWINMELERWIISKYLIHNREDRRKASTIQGILDIPVANSAALWYRNCALIQFVQQNIHVISLTCILIPRIHTYMIYPWLILKNIGQVHRYQTQPLSSVIILAIYSLPKRCGNVFLVFFVTNVSQLRQIRSLLTWAFFVCGSKWGDRGIIWSYVWLMKGLLLHCGRAKIWNIHKIAYILSIQK